MPRSSRVRTRWSTNVQGTDNATRAEVAPEVAQTPAIPYSLASSIIAESDRPATTVPPSVDLVHPPTRKRMPHSSTFFFLFLAEPN